MRLAGGPADPIAGFRLGSVVDGGLAHDLVAENDRDLSFFRTAFDRFEARLAWIFGVHSSDVVLQAGHEEEQTDDGKRPRDEHNQKEHLIGSHTGKCLRP